MPLISKNIDFGRPMRASSWRKVAIGTWRSAGDPSVYAVVDLDAGPALAYLDQLKAQTGVKLTLTHFVGRAIAEVLGRHPDINCMLRFGRLYPRKTVDVFFQVASDTKGVDLSGMTIRRANEKSMAEIAQEMQKNVKEIREKGDPGFRKMKKTMGGLPGFLSRYVLGFAGFLLYSLNIWTPLLGSPRDPFGSCMVTSIGSLGLDFAFAPLVPYSRVPLLLSVGAVREDVVVRNGQPVVRPMLRICVTIDHRIIDGMHASHMSRTLAKIFETPQAELERSAATV